MSNRNNFLADLLDSTFVGVDLTATNKSWWATSRAEGSGWFLHSNESPRNQTAIINSLIIENHEDDFTVSHLFLCGGRVY